jgi:ATP-binding cassette subfamily B protein
MLLATLCSILNKIFDLAPPLLIGLAVEIVVERENSWLAKFLGWSDPMTQIWILAGLTLLIWILESVFEYAAKVLWRNLAQTIQHEIRLDGYAHVQRLEMAWFEERSTGGVMSILSDDINQLERFLDGGAHEVVQVSTTVVVIGAIYFFLAPEVAWVAMLPMPFILWGSMKFTGKIGPRYADVRERVSLLNGRLAGNLGGIATIKSYTSEDYEVERIREDSEDYRTSNRRAIRLSSAFSPLIRMVIVCGFTGTLVIGGKMALAGEIQESAYTVLVFLTQRLLWPLTRMGETFDLFQRAMASTRRVLDLIDTEPAIRAGRQRLRMPKGKIAFEDVSFSYPRRPGVIRNLTLDLPAGETTAVVGSTGSGKTTLVKLLLRFYDVTEGRVTLDGTNIRDLDFPSLRGSIGLVSQDVFLFHGTVRENIAYGRPGVDDGEIVSAAKIAEVHDFIESLPDGYGTIVGERGQKLSGGQRQRISIARAILKDPAVLVLDEATSSVDNETEAAIQRSLAKISVDRTTLVIAHRLSTVRNAHRIHVLSEGVLAEHGTHEELLAVNGIYAALWRVQTGTAVAQTS